MWRRVPPTCEDEYVCPTASWDDIACNHWNHHHHQSCFICHHNLFWQKVFLGKNIFRQQNFIVLVVGILVVGYNIFLSPAKHSKPDEWCFLPPALVGLAKQTWNDIIITMITNQWMNASCTKIILSTHDDDHHHEKWMENHLGRGYPSFAQQSRRATSPWVQSGHFHFLLSLFFTTFTF